MDPGTLLQIFLITLAAFGVAVAAMAVGAIFAGRCLHGSCGGGELRTRDGLSLRCLVCPNRQRRNDGLPAPGGADPEEDADRMAGRGGTS